jgi:hypothetical protein
VKTSVRCLSVADLGRAAAEVALKGACRLQIIFGPSHLKNDSLFTQSVEAFPATDIVVGCSTAGEIHDGAVDDETITLATVEFESTRLKKTYFALKSPEDSFDAGYAMAQALKDPELKGILVFSDGLQVNGSQLIAGFNFVFEGRVTVTGGLAGDGSRFESTWVLNERTPKAGVVVAVGFYGDKIRFQHGSQGGWGIFGPERLITKSKGNVLFEIDGQPALALYKNYLGDKAKDLPASGLLFPMQIWKSGEANSQVVRTILAVDEKAGSLTFAGDMPEGYSAQLMRANLDRLIDGAGHAATDVGAVEPGLCVAISCVGRRLLLGDRVEEETEAVLANLPRGCHQIGFYSYGEISPLGPGQPAHLHNQTMTVTYISEGEDHAA